MQKLISFFVACICCLGVYGCGSSPLSAPPEQATATRAAISSATSPAPHSSTTATVWVPPTALVGTPIAGAQATLTAAPPLRMAPLLITNSRGEEVKMMVEIADTQASRELGLMHRSSMPPDAGMLFDFGMDTTSGFWMQNTILPLSIAFIKADGTILNTADMKPLDTSTVEAAGPYQYALETNQGFFAAHSIVAGNRVTLPGAQSVVIPGMPDCTQK